MKLLSFEHAGKTSFGVLRGDGVLDLGPYASDVGHTLQEAIANGAFGAIATIAERETALIPLDQVRFLPVIPAPGKILCVGINYASHVKETGREMPKHPMFFTRFADSQVAHGQPIIRPRASQKLDFEGELAVVIGRTARHVSSENALEFVAGYSCYNDGSVRDWQKHTIQFTPGKNFPQTGGFGPWLVTTDEIPDPSKLSLTTRLNGEVVQAATTDDLIFSVGDVIAYCSTFTELHAGDVIITGTTGGVGAFREPPLWMKPGDVVEVEISGIGTLRNSIKDE
ncbi:5-carboxymethyl-2-hydroxymuconate delta-isomerase [Paraburkholderia piptadeniae]|uniref:5-carboxymethyl-2-hydroxymuconate delta-isomerase n=1 Tax=Paraburkholderia piptadeniae TaxID=1701573 RepID=A0A1N7SN53_9BURK|nr:fumarylacetoacetate hydrolase family protein [Paraburkholderia piptadeniae]SIT48850.1 5-carboxymethyl-2-hydroxymuconate delta-isomerase [Paraburkholderia piptadeniae]